MKKGDNTGVIVLGGHIQALGIVRAFGRMNLPVIVIDNTRKNISRHSKFCKESYLCPDQSLLEFLIDPGTTEKYQNWTIFPTNDYHVFILSNNKELLSKYYRISTDHWEKVLFFYNKIKTYQLAQTLQIPIPSTIYPKNSEDLKNYQYNFPCIVKPAIMHEFYSKMKKKVLFCQNENDLISNYHLALKYIPADQIIIQDVIPGNGQNQFSACFLFLKGKTYVSLTAIRMRQHPLDFGKATTYAEITNNTVITEYAEKLLGAVDYNGVCEVEFKLDKRDGQYKLLDVNPRTWKWHSIAEKAGTPFLQTFYRFINHEQIDVHQGGNFASFRHTLTDFPIQLKLLFKGTRSAFRKKKPVVNATWAFADWKPWFYEKLYFFNLIRNR